MKESLEASLVRIFTTDGYVVGAGFLVGERHLLTCAHVVAGALSLADDIPEKPQAPGHLDIHGWHRGNCSVLMSYCGDLHVPMEAMISLAWN